MNSTIHSNTRFVFTRLSILIFIYSLTLSFSFEAAAKSLCLELFRIESTTPLNSSLKHKYDNIDKIDQGDGEFTFKDYLNQYVRALNSKNEQLRAIRIMNETRFGYYVTERMYLLLKRDVTSSYQVKMTKELQKIDALQARIGSWQALKSHSRSSEKANLLLEKSAPGIDGENIKKKVEIENWNQSMQFVEMLSENPRKHLTEWDVAKIAALLQGIKTKNEDVSFIDAKFYSHYDINFMYTLDKKNKLILDPLNSFIPGSQKIDGIRYFIEWLSKNRNKTHPIVLAAQARQLIVSIHPLPDGNGRFARLIANYILMRAGYPPAFIPKGDDSNNASVALFPLKNFEDQISPEETIQIMINGVQRSQNILLSP